MKKLLILISSALLLGQAGEVVAGPRKLLVDASHLPSGLSAARINRKLQEFGGAAFSYAGVNKSTSAERVATISNYDFTRPAGSRLVDTVRLTYLSGRGSAFNYASLDYDFYNYTSHNNPFIFNNNFVHYDIARDARTGAILQQRAYNAAGKVVQETSDTALFQFSYDASNRISQIVHHHYNSASGAWEINYRDLYTYNNAGQLILDSLESWDLTTAAWQHQEKLVYSYDASGRVSVLNVVYDMSGGRVYQIARQTVSYPGSAAYPSSILTELSTGFGLDSNWREDFTYASGAMVSHDQYQWSSGVWGRHSQEIRHLNAASLPDSVFYRYWNGGQAIDSTYAKLGYDGQNNPLYRLDYDRTSTVPWGGSSWTYEPFTSTGIARVRVERLEFYPNPATEKIQLKGISEGNYLIFNMAGQLMQSGKVQNGGAISVQLLSPGMYTMQVQDTRGQAYSTRFMRQ